MIKKIIPVVLSLAMVCTTASYANHTEKKEAKLLTYEKAVELAVKNSLEIKRTEKQISKQETSNEELDFQGRILTDTINQNPEYDQMIDKVSFGLEKSILEKDFYEKQVRYTKVVLEFTIRNLFNEIDTVHEEIKLHDKEIGMLKKEIAIADVKKERGLISKYDYNALNNSLQEMQKNKTQKYLTLNKHLLELNKYLNLKDLNEYSIVEIPYSFKPLNLKEEEIKLKGMQASSANMQVAAKEHGVSLQNLILDRNLYEGSRAIRQADVYIDQTEILKLKEDIRSGVAREYQSLKLLQEKIELLQQQREIKVEELENEKIKLVAGKVSSFSLEKKKMELEQMDVQIQELIKAYETSKIHFNQIYLTGSSM